MLNHQLIGEKLKEWKWVLLAHLLIYVLRYLKRGLISSHHWLFTEGRAGHWWIWRMSQCEPAQCTYKSLRQAAGSGRQSTCSHILGRLGLVPPSAFHILSENGNFSKYFARVMFRREVIFKFYSHSEFNEILLQTGLQWTSKAELNESFTSVLVAAISFPYSLLMGGLGPTIAGLKIEPFELGQQFCFLGKLVAVLWKKHLETGDLNFISCSLKFPEPQLLFQ